MKRPTLEELRRFVDASNAIEGICACHGDLLFDQHFAPALHFSTQLFPIRVQ